MSAATVTAAADSNAIVDVTATASAANKTWTLKEKWQWWAGNTWGSLAKWLLPPSRLVFPKCIRLTNAIFLLNIAIRWAAFKIGWLEAVAVAVLWFKALATDKQLNKFKENRCYIRVPIF